MSLFLINLRRGLLGTLLSLITIASPLLAHSDDDPTLTLGGGAMKSEGQTELLIRLEANPIRGVTSKTSTLQYYLVKLQGEVSGNLNNPSYMDIDIQGVGLSNQDGLFKWEAGFGNLKIERDLAIDQDYTIHASLIHAKLGLGGQTNKDVEVYFNVIVNLITASHAQRASDGFNVNGGKGLASGSFGTGNVALQLEAKFQKKFRLIAGASYSQMSGDSVYAGTYTSCDDYCVDSECVEFTCNDDDVCTCSRSTCQEYERRCSDHDMYNDLKSFTKSKYYLELQYQVVSQLLLYFGVNYSIFESQDNGGDWAGKTKGNWRMKFGAAITL